MRRWDGAWLCACVLAACASPSFDLPQPVPGVVFTYPMNHQVDVPVGARLVVSFSVPIDQAAIADCAAFCVMGPDGPITGETTLANDRTLHFTSTAFAEGTSYDVVVGAALAPEARNLPASGPLLSFTTRNLRPRAAAPTLIAVNGGDPAEPESFRMMLDTSTIRLVFSEPLDPRTVTLAAGSIELVSDGAPVAATIIHNGIHVSIDPLEPLVAGATYQVNVGDKLRDLSGQAMTPVTSTLVPRASVGRGPYPQRLRIRAPSDPGPAQTRSGAEPNMLVVDKPLTGRLVTTVKPGALVGELGDPNALDGPIGATLSRGGRLRANGLDIAFGGAIPSGLETGDILLELVSDGGGVLYRNPYQPADVAPDSELSPIYVDLSLDAAAFTADPQGNAVLSQTVLGVQATGIATLDNGALVLEAVAALELDMLGVSRASANLTLELTADPNAMAEVDRDPPALIASLPAANGEAAVDSGIELLFSEPLDLERARAGIGLRAGGTTIPTLIESHGAALVVRPLQRLAYGTSYQVDMTGLADLAGNMIGIQRLAFTTPTLGSPNTPMSVLAISPGVPCTLTGATATSPGRCAGGGGSDDLYHPFTLPANNPVDVLFTQPLRASSVTLGTACGQGSVRIEALDEAGACTGVVSGSLLVRDRQLSFIPDTAWAIGSRYRVTLVAGNNGTCSAGELCGPTMAANFDPLAGTQSDDAGSGDLVVNFRAVPPTGGTYVFAPASPFTDVNGSGFKDTNEIARDANRAAFRVDTTTGLIQSATFNGADCIPETPQKEACMYVLGALAVELGELSTECGGFAPQCVPITIPPQALFGTSVSLAATAIITINADTGQAMLRVREPATGGTTTGYIFERDGKPVVAVVFDLYMDAPDMAIPLVSHDLHSKAVTATLEGSVVFMPDGRIAIQASNIDDVRVTIGMSALGIDGGATLLLPHGELRLQLLSQSSRGAAR